MGYKWKKFCLLDKVQSTKYNRDFSVGKPYLNRYFDLVKTYVPKQDEEEDEFLGVRMATEVFRVIFEIKGGGEGYVSGQIFFSSLCQHKHIYKQHGNPGHYVKGKCDLLTFVSGPHHVVPSLGYAVCFVDLLLSKSDFQPLTVFEIPQVARLKLGPKCPSMTDDETDDELMEHEGIGNFVRITNCRGCFGKTGWFKETKFDGLAFHQSRYTMFDKPQRYKVCSSDNKSSVTILYACFREAVRANVEVILVDDVNKEFCVYGLVATKNDLIQERNYEIILFREEDSSQSITVESGEPMQLSRSQVVVPVNSNLLVRVHLRTNDNKKFPSAKFVFPAQSQGVTELPVKDRMVVKVTWYPY